MTVIAYDRATRTMASDSRMTQGEISLSTPKLFRLPDGGICGMAGESSDCAAMLEYLQGKADRPESSDAEVIHVTPDGVVWLYANSIYADEVSDPFVCIGTGGTIAFTMLACDFTLEQAIAKAIELAHACGGAIQQLRLDGPING